MSNPAPPILIAGPTASGKSALALELAAVCNGHIINADALQVYDCWSILSARPSAEETAQAPHALYGHIGKHTPYSAGHWLKDVEKQILTATKLEQRPIIIGGTGLYFTALTKGLAEIPAIPDDVRAKGNEMRIMSGTTQFIEVLADKDPQSLAALDANNPARLQRAWEVLVATGRGLADWHALTPAPLVDPKTAQKLLLDADRDWLADRIDHRFDLMMDAGAIAEVQAYIADGWNPERPSAQAIGAPDIVAFLNGEITRETAIQNAKAQSRQYAKRQRTWFRSKMKEWRKVDPKFSMPASALHEIVTSLS